MKIGDFELSVVPRVSTSPAAGLPDIGPGMGQARDAALDAEARRGMHADAPVEGDTSDVEQALNAAIAEGRRKAGIGGTT